MRTILKAIATGFVAVSLGIGLSSCSSIFGSLGYGGYGYDEYGYNGYGYGYPGYYPGGPVVRPRPRVTKRTRTVTRPVVVNQTTNVIYTYDNRTGRVVATRAENPHIGKPVYNGNGRSSSRTVTRTTMPDMRNPRATVSRSSSYSSSRSTSTATRSARNSGHRPATVKTETRVNTRWSAPAERTSDSRTVKTTTQTVTRSSAPAKTTETTKKDGNGHSRPRR